VADVLGGASDEVVRDDGEHDQAQPQVDQGAEPLQSEVDERVGT
jgi:hypothetical protein